MAGREFTDEQLKELRENPNVAFAKGNRISYTLEFKEHFVREYAAGKRPGRIFEEAGFDVGLLGTKRIERASARWRKSSNLGLMASDVNFVETHKDRRRNQTNEFTILERLRQLEAEVEELNERIRELEQTSR